MTKGTTKLGSLRHDSAPLLALLAIVGAAGLLGSMGSIVIERAVTSGLIMLVVVVGLYVFVGVSGILSFGHIGFMAIGAYTSAIFTMPQATKAWVLPDLPSGLSTIQVGAVPGTLVAAGVAGVVALLLSFPVLRLDGVQATLVTLAALVIVHEVALNWDEVTKGSSFLSGTPTDTTLVGAAAWAGIAIVVAFLFQRSGHGKRLAASREDPLAAAAIGVNVVRERRIAFVLSAMVVAAGGSVWAHFVSGFTPESFYFTVTFITIAMLIIGGSRSLAGALVGTAFVSVLTELLRRVENTSWPIVSTTGLAELGLAAAIIVVLVVRPQGLMAGREITFAAARSRLGRARTRTCPADVHPVGAVPAPRKETRS